MTAFLKGQRQTRLTLHKLSSYHPNITFTVEEENNNFLDTEFDYSDKFTTIVYQKPGKPLDISSAKKIET